MNAQEFWNSFETYKDLLMDIDSAEKGEAEALLQRLDNDLKQYSEGIDFVLGDLSDKGRTLTFTCEGEPAQDSRAAAYATRHFEVIGEQAIVSGENALTFTLHADDPYFMLLLTSGEAQELAISGIRLHRTQESL